MAYAKLDKSSYILLKEIIKKEINEAVFKAINNLEFRSYANPQSLEDKIIITMKEHIK